MWFLLQLLNFSNSFFLLLFLRPRKNMKIFTLIYLGGLCCVGSRGWRTLLGFDHPLHFSLLGAGILLRIDVVLGERIREEDIASKL